MEAPSGYFGASVARREDRRLLMGAGKFAADLKLPGMADVVFWRSPLAHGRVDALDVEEARNLEGVLAVYTAADLEGKVESFTRPFYKTINPEVERQSRLEIVPYRADLLVKEWIVRVGEPLAAVVAVDRYTAEDALELIEVDIDPLPVVADVESALAQDAPR